MKRIIYLGTLLLGMVCLASCSSKPKDARVVVKEFLQYIKEGDNKKIEQYYPGLSGWSTIRENGKVYTSLEFLKKYGPNWEPEKTIVYEMVDTIKEGRVIVHAQYGGKKASFLINVGKKGAKIYDFVNFLNLESAFKKEKGFTIEKGKNCTDTDLWYTLHNFDEGETDPIEEVISCVNNFNKSLTQGKIASRLYPKAQSFGNYIVADSIAPKIKNIRVYRTDHRRYVVECEKQKTFYVNENYVITNSIGLYKFNEKIADVCARYNYEYYRERPEKDVEAEKVASEVEKEISYRAYHKERAEYYRKVGLVIDYLKLVRGKDKDGDPATGFQIKFFNPTSKTIKYIVIYTTALNGVNDAMGRKVARGIGPIKPGESGSYDFSDLYYDRNGIIQDFSVSIELTYTDGSRKTVKWKDAMASQDGFENVVGWVYNELLL